MLWIATSGSKGTCVAMELKPRKEFSRVSRSALRISPMHLKPHRTDAVILAITNVKRAAVDEDAVWPREFARKRITVWAVATLASADHCGNHSVSQIDPSNDMVFCVGYIECAFRGIRDAFRSIKFRKHCVAAVAGVSHFTCSCNQLELASYDIDLEHPVALT